MLAKRVDLNVPHNDELIVVLMKYCSIHDVAQILLVSLREEHHSFRVSIGRLQKALPVWIFTNAF